MMGVFKALDDVVKICTEESIEYRVIGSAAMVGSVGHAYRVPGDVDVLVDESKKQILEERLAEKGYAKSVGKNMFDDIFPNSFSRFTKGNQIIEPRYGECKNGTFECRLLLPIPILPKEFRPKAKLIFGSHLFKAEKMIYSGVKFVGLQREALYLLLKISSIPLKFAEGKSSKRLLDVKEISTSLDPKIINLMKNEKSGVYFAGLPLITFRRLGLIKILTLLSKN